MADRSTAITLEIDSIAVDPSSTTTGEVQVSEIPREIAEITSGLIGQQPQSNPLIVLKAARWWYVHGRGTHDPVFQWAIEWTRNLATDKPPDVQRYDAFLDRLVEVGFAADRRELRSQLISDE